MHLNKAIESIYYDTIRDQVGICGWCYDYYGNDYSLTVKINGKVWPVTERRRPLNYLVESTVAEPGFDLCAKLDGEPFKTVEVFVECLGETECLVKRTKSQMRNWIVTKPILYNLDSVELTKDSLLVIRGWRASMLGTIPTISIVNEQGEEEAFDIDLIKRPDVVRVRGLEEGQVECGFQLRYEYPSTGNYQLRFFDGTNEVRIKIDRGKLNRENFLMKTGIRKTQIYLKQNGLKATIKKVFIKVFHIETVKYAKWFKMISLTPEELAIQRAKKFAYTPKISFVVPLYQTPEIYLKEMIESVLAQTYSNLELCLADGSGEGADVSAIVMPYVEADSRVRYQKLDKNLGIAGNSNAAIAMATGDYIALLDHDDTIAPEAAYKIVEALNEDDRIEVLYTDEDKLSMNGKRHFEPNFKSDFNIDMLRAVNYICHMFVVKKTLMDQLGGFRLDVDGAQDYDLILRATEATEHIKHIQRVVYHWRCHANSTAINPESKMYAFEAGIRVLNEHYQRVGLCAHAEHGIRYGMYKTVYEWNREPLVSVLIPTKDHWEDLNVVINSLENVVTYKNLEIIVIENNSTEQDTWDYYEKIQKEYSNVKVVVWKGNGGFNYSSINNYGAKYATGEYLLLLNNDVEFINPDTIQEMLGYAMRQDVGAVGALLYYNDDTIQHAGVILGLGGVAGHCFPGVPKGDCGYMGRNMYAQDLSAVTAACLMVSKEKFYEVGQLDEGLAVAFNDVDFCMQLRKAGYLNVFNPYAILYHYESKSRGLEDTPEKQKRFQKEINYFRDRWKDELLAGDPYYNPNLTLDKNDFSLRNLYTNMELR